MAFHARLFRPVDETQQEPNLRAESAGVCDRAEYSANEEEDEPWTNDDEQLADLISKLRTFSLLVSSSNLDQLRHLLDPYERSVTRV